MLRFLDRLQPVGLLLLRLGLGAIMIVHGKQKVFGGMPQFIDAVHKIGFGTMWAYLAAYTELIGGVLLVAGLLTRLAAIPVIIDMLVAIVKVHWHAGFTGQGNYQFPLALAIMAFALVCFGAGPVSLDRVFGGKRR